jgi:hypothetical protein
VAETTDKLDTDASVKRLNALLRYLNAAYLTRMATLAPSRSADADGPPMLTVQRGRTAADVVVAAVWDSLTHRFVVAAYTSTAWYSHGEPFQLAECTQVRHAATFTLQFIPIHPTT